MSKQKIKPLREPLSRIWFLSRGYKQADPRYVDGKIAWLHPETNVVLSKYGTKMPMRLLPYEKYHKTTTRYLAIGLPGGGTAYLARLKYLTFVGPIPKGYTIDHIDGNTFNNDIRNLRAIPDAINRRDAGFMRKLRNNGYNVAMFPGIILEGYARMAEWKKTHTRWQYKCLHGQELLRVFVGPQFQVVDISPLDDLNINRHYDPFIERD